MSNIISVPLRHRCCGPLASAHFVAVVAAHLSDDEADEEHSEEDGDDDDDDEEALAGRRKAVQRVLRLQIIDLVSSLCINAARCWPESGKIWPSLSLQST